MTTKELQKRSERSHDLRVLKSNGNYFVESAEGMVLYKVNSSGEPDKFICTCGDYARGVKNDPNFQCKHILAVLSCVMTEQAEFLEKKKPKLDERFITEIEGREFVKFAGLLDLGHQKGILKIEVEPLQFPNKDNGNFAICKAVVLSRSGETYSDIGDANPLNTTSKVSKHLLRMASTRAIGRALRSFTNIGNTMLEELGDWEEVIGEEPSKQSKSRKPIPKEAPKPAEPQAAEGPKAGKGNGSNGGNGSNAKTKAAETKPEETKPAAKPESKPAPKGESKGEQPAPVMSSAQKNAIYNLSRRRGISVEELGKMSQKDYGVPLENLSSTNASTFIRQLQQSA
jgi:hypothetical protein